MIAWGHFMPIAGYTRGDEIKPNEKPIHYLSHKVTASQTNWPTIEKEAFPIFYAVQKLDQYLLDSEFGIRTDHKPLKYMYIMDSPVQNKTFRYRTTNIHGYSCKTEYTEECLCSHVVMLAT